MCLSHSMAWSPFPLISSPPHPLFWAHVAPATLTSCRPPAHQTHSCVRALAAAVPLAQNALPSYISMANSLTYLKSLLRCLVFNEIYSDHPIENCNSPLQLPIPPHSVLLLPFPSARLPPNILYPLFITCVIYCLSPHMRTPAPRGQGSLFCSLIRCRHLEQYLVYIIGFNKYLLSEQVSIL